MSILSIQAIEKSNVMPTSICISGSDVWFMLLTKTFNLKSNAILYMQHIPHTGNIFDAVNEVGYCLPCCTERSNANHDTPVSMSTDTVICKHKSNSIQCTQKLNHTVSFENICSTVPVTFCSKQSIHCAVQTTICWVPQQLYGIWHYMFIMFITNIYMHKQLF